MKTPLVTVDWLIENINHPDLIVLDASMGVVGKSEIGNLDGYIPTSMFFDIKKRFSDPSSSYPNTFPSEKQFEREARKLGINNDSLIVIYDNKGIYSSPRAWWMFRAFGHETVAVLDGGLPTWIKNGYEVVPQRFENKAMGNFKAQFQENMISDRHFLLKNLKYNDSIVLDARSKGRFDGSAIEPRKGLKSGHIPNSINLPFSELIEDGKMLDSKLLKDKFGSIVNKEAHLVFSCGSGITACILALGADLADFGNIGVYDGSWSEWGSQEELPIE